MQISFGGLILDTDTRQLQRNGADVHLSPKALDLLSLLVTERPRALSKTELLEKLWPGAFVTENNLASLVVEIRQAIGDDARTPRFVRTVQRFGYAFKGEAGPPSSRIPAKGRADCWLVVGTRRIALATGENVLGREGDGIIALGSETVSRRHARIVVDDAAATLEDLGSKNGTRLKGRLILASELLANGDEIGLGAVVLTFCRMDTGHSTRTWRQKT